MRRHDGLHRFDVLFECRLRPTEGMRFQLYEYFLLLDMSVRSQVARTRTE